MFYLNHSLQVFRQTSVTATEKGFEPSKLVSGKKEVKSRDTLSDLQLQPVENKRELMRQLSARCDGQISNFPLKETAGVATSSIFFRLLFVQNNIDLPGGQINHSSSGTIIPQHPRLGLHLIFLFLDAHAELFTLYLLSAPFMTGLYYQRSYPYVCFWRRHGTLQRPSTLPRALLSGLQKNKDTARCATLNTEVP